MSLNWKEIAELVGLTAILAGMYLVYEEIQQNSTIARAELSSANFQRMAELRDDLLDPTFSDLYQKGVQSPETLKQSERQLLVNYYGSFIWVLVSEYQNYNLGIFAEYDQMARIVARQQFSRGFGRAYWNAVRNGINPDIVSNVDEELDRIDSLRELPDLDQEIVRQIEAL
jgi:hypothetical protein